MKINNSRLTQDIKYFYKLKQKHTPFYTKVVDDKLIRGRSTSNLFRLYDLKKQGITQIIDLRNNSTELSEIFPQYIERIFCKIFKINYVNYKYNHKIDGIPNMDFFNRINNRILNNNGKTFIHCRHGKRRTGVCVAVYEKLHTKKSKEEILDELYHIGFKELCSNSSKIPERVYVRLIKIYNNFLTKFYPSEQKLNYNC